MFHLVRPIRSTTPLRPSSLNVNPNNIVTSLKLTTPFLHRLFQVFQGSGNPDHTPAVVPGITPVIVLLIYAFLKKYDVISAPLVNLAVPSPTYGNMVFHYPSSVANIPPFHSHPSLLQSTSSFQEVGMSSDRNSLNFILEKFMIWSGKARFLEI